MNRLRLIALIALLSAWAAPAQHPSIFAQDGNVVVRGRDGRDHRITTSGSDYDPSISCDVRHVVFVRKIRDHPDASGLGRLIDQSQIWIADLTGVSPALRMVLDHPVELGGYRSQWFTSPKLGPGGEVVYFLDPEYSTASPGLYRLDLASGQTHFLVGALEFWPVFWGYYKGNIIVHQSLMFVGGGRYDIYNMIDSSGALVGAAGLNKGQIRNLGFLACQDPNQ